MNTLCFSKATTVCFKIEKIIFDYLYIAEMGY